MLKHLLAILLLFLVIIRADRNLCPEIENIYIYHSVYSTEKKGSESFSVGNLTIARV